MESWSPVQANVQRNVPRPTLKRVLGIMLDMARGLEYLHTRTPAIIHRDVKSSNILINRTGVAKVGDFGLARVKHSTRSMIRSLVGTVNWQAPELWHPEPQYDYKVDVFSAGVVYWEMLAGWVGEKVSVHVDARCEVELRLTIEIPVGGAQRALHIRCGREEAPPPVGSWPRGGVGGRARTPHRTHVAPGPEGEADHDGRGV